MMVVTTLLATIAMMQEKYTPIAEFKSGKGRRKVPPPPLQSLGGVIRYQVHQWFPFERQNFCLSKRNCLNTFLEGGLEVYTVARITANKASFFNTSNI